MIQRDFTEIDLQDMFDRARHYRPDIGEGRWVIETCHLNRDWEIIVELDPEEQLLVIITAYSI